ncbi:MAG: hypothetical protein H6Q90_424 [Deltaproteobacteria bacterium]|nr:hypothetical protein [Deltaproteobacteria bacterium]
MKIIFATVLLFGFSGSAYAEDTCFEVSSDSKVWSKTPEMLCISQVKDSDYTLALRTGIPGSQQEVLTLHFNLISRAKCIDCNHDVFGIANPTNSVANALGVKFDGKRDVKTMEEKGTVKIGATRLFYRGKAGAAATPPPAAPKTAPAAPAKT